ncbi:hypothetical protein SCHPADRAFT_900700 [Schizopora paradoxa]|uniref:Inositol hexakisphosphate-domain-containing protein n=1 Tax=Schizopora paradoxa TaxID=27342 RepID=A0A0H2S0E5_9AGAM|nr:hypothetical protein SCHPADRAFT_900700 [Schizopora paradoxa]
MSSPLQLRLNSLGLSDKRSRSSASPVSLTRPSSSLSRDHERFKSNPSQTNGRESLDLTPQLQRSVLSAVKARSGSVLSRGFILKTDHYPSGRALDLDLTVHGSPNFRTPKVGDFNVFGVAQPRTQGLRAILSILRCRPDTQDPYNCVWFSTREEPIVYISGRSFVLRDASEPRKTLRMSDRAENLEGIEERLKNDILQESQKYGGLILTHNEVATDHSGDGAILPTWTAVDANNVKTSKELWESMKKDGWRVDYHRIPVSPDRPIEDNYLDAYVRVIKECDPLKTSLVFSCGMGAVRTTFAMVAALLVRRKQLLLRGIDDPFHMKSAVSHSSSGISTPTNSQIALSLEQANAQQELSKSLLRLTYVLQQSLQNHDSQSAIELLLTQPMLMDNLCKAHLGNYGVILSLLGCLDHGMSTKQLVDKVIDACDHVVNLREEIIVHRLRYSITNYGDKQGDAYIDKAVRALEKYFFMIAFASYVEEQVDVEFREPFSSWLKARTEIWNQVTFLRKIYGSRLNVFAPIHDLSALSKTSESLSNLPGVTNDIVVAGGQVLGDEYSEHVLKTRSGVILREGTILKSDRWFSESVDVANGVRGANNFRNIPDTMIYALGQPSIDAIDEVVHRIKLEHPTADHIAWITLREEPVVYINGAPYCLRREGFSLRNMKDYGGISGPRLETLEERLRDDVVNELNKFGGRLLLHTETSDGAVIPIWEDVSPRDVEVLKDIMAYRERIGENMRLHYKRIPITAEKPPDFSDVSDLMNVVIQTHSTNTPIILNCQLGRGRSTMTSIIILLIQQWLQIDSTRTRSRSRGAQASPLLMMRSNSIGDISAYLDPSRHSYQVINNLLRVIKNGLLVKETVDQAIDKCSEVFNMRDSIEDARAQAEQASSDVQKRVHAQRGLHNLRRYFDLIIFQWYLSSVRPDVARDMVTLETFVKNHPVIQTFENDLHEEGLNALKPLERVELTDGVAQPDEAKQVVANRNGSILSASTILKSDFFSNLQKMSLPERIEGAPNFRRVSLILQFDKSSQAAGTEYFTEVHERMVCGSGMPTVEGLRRALIRVNADPKGSNTVYWTSLREEPVLYVAGRPHVLRLVDRPLENVEATGVTTQTVEDMEIKLKRDVLRELRKNEGRLLLHDEVEERPGVFTILPQWEVVDYDDVLTPRDVFELMKKEGYKINYDRVAITDEQAPLPDALSQLYERVKLGLANDQAGDFIFNCQMGRGRTTTGMISACLVANLNAWDGTKESLAILREQTTNPDVPYDTLDGPSEEEAYLQGEYKIILQLVGVLSFGKSAKAVSDRAIDMMQDVQNIRKAIYDYKLKIEACPKGSEKERKLTNLGMNYLYRYGALIVFANYLIETKMNGSKSESWPSFPVWLKEHREITTILGRRTLA